MKYSVQLAQAEVFFSAPFRRCQCAMFESLVYFSGSQSVALDQLWLPGSFTEKRTFLSS